jgi:hypothetical protein
MTLTNTEKELNHIQSVVETGLNYAGYIPLVSSLSGSLRIQYGKIEVIGAIATGALLAGQAFFEQNGEERSKKLNRAVEVLTTYATHGVANIFRGILEMIPFLSLVVCLPYDLMKNRFIYPQEERAKLRPLQEAFR